VADPASTLRREDLDEDPIRQFEAWHEEARAAGIVLAEACAVATVSPAGLPSARMVLLKGTDERGFVFATSYASRKGRDLDASGRAALLFYWQALGRQVRVEGTAERVAADESDAIFLARPRASRISALASRQSEPLGDRATLEARVAQLERELEGREVERPEFWGAYRVVPDEVEVWQHDDDRLHRRFVYRRSGTGWEIEGLQP
jgi:pyridoxamine 5'-phosphate oxidase